MTNKAKAHCLCGRVRFNGHIKGDAVQACHCKQCQRWTGGGPLMTVRVTDLEIEGAEAIGSYHASEHGERAFCQICGTTLYWKLKDRQVAFLPVGLFEDQTGLTVREEIFVDHRPDWLPAWRDAEQHKEAEMLAQLDAFLQGDAQ